MEAVLHTVGHSVALAVEAMAIIIIAIGAVEAVANVARIMRAEGTDARSARPMLRDARPQEG